MTELPTLRDANTIRLVMEDPSFVAALCRNTAEHIDAIIDWLLPEYDEPAIEDVATTIGSLLQAGSEIRFGVGDILVAIDKRRRESYLPDEDWTLYLKKVESMIGQAIGYHRLRVYYNTSYMVPKEFRRPDRAYTWYSEWTRLAAAMLKGETMGWDEKRDRKAQLVAEFLADPVTSELSISQIRRKKLAVGKLPVTYVFDYPPYVDAVSTETGERVRFLTFVEKPWSDIMTEAIRHLLWGLDIMQRSITIEYLSDPILIRHDKCLYIRSTDPEEGWVEELVAELGEGELVESVYNAVLKKWRMVDG